MLPFVLRRLGLDPASASAPFVATLVDVTGHRHLLQRRDAAAARHAALGTAAAARRAARGEGRGRAGRAEARAWAAAGTPLAFEAGMASVRIRGPDARMTTRDAGFLYLERPHAPLHIGCVAS